MDTKQTPATANVVDGFMAMKQLFLLHGFYDRVQVIMAKRLSVNRKPNLVLTMNNYQTWNT